MLWHVVCSLGFYGNGVSFQVVFGQSLWLKILPGGACIAQPRWVPVRRILGGGRTHGVSFWSFPNSSHWWRLINSVFLTRTSCCIITYANGYYGFWPEWAISVRVLPLTKVWILLYVTKYMTKWTKAYSGLSKWALNVIICILIIGSFETETRRRREKMKKQCDCQDRDWSDGTTRQGIPLATRSCKGKKQVLF